MDFAQKIVLSNNQMHRTSQGEKNWVTICRFMCDVPINLLKKTTRK